jgi:KTSC domain
MNMLDFDDNFATPSLPELFEYDEQTKVLEVEYADGVRVRYFDVPETMHFLLPKHVNPHKVPDFLQARSKYRSEKINADGGSMATPNPHKPTRGY